MKPWKQARLKLVEEAAKCAQSAEKADKPKYSPRRTQEPNTGRGHKSNQAKK